MDFGASRFDTPVPSIFNPIFQFYYLWKFLSDFTFSGETF